MLSRRYTLGTQQADLGAVGLEGEHSGVVAYGVDCAAHREVQDRAHVEVLVVCRLAVCCCVRHYHHHQHQFRRYNSRTTREVEVLERGIHVPCSHCLSAGLVPLLSRACRC